MSPTQQASHDLSCFLCFGMRINGGFPTNVVNTCVSKSRTAESMVIVANNSTLQEFAAESKPVRPITRDFTVAYISLSESGYCRHKSSYVEFRLQRRSIL